MKKIIWLTNLPAPYRIEFFNQLGQFVDLQVIFERSKSDNRNINWFDYNFNNFKGIILEGKCLKDMQKIKKILSQEKFDFAFNSDYSSCLGMYFYFLCKKENIKLILEADGGIPKYRGPLDKIISLIMRSYSFYFSSGRYTDLYFKYYNIDENKIIHYNFTSLTENEIKINSMHKLREDEHILNVLSIGQQIYRKGFDILIKAISKLDFEITVDIIGGKPSPEIKKMIIDNSLENIKFYDFMKKEELNEYFLKADMFVLPSREEIWGLVVNEAISFNLPVITSDNCIAGKEFCDLAEIGLIYENENYTDLANKIKTLHDDQEMRYKLSRNCELINMEFTIENMAKKHVDFIYNYKSEGQ